MKCCWNQGVGPRALRRLKGSLLLRGRCPLTVDPGCPLRGHPCDARVAPSDLSLSAVDKEFGAGNEARVGGGEENGCACDVFGTTCGTRQIYDWVLLFEI